MEQNCNECLLISDAKKEVAQHIIDMYHQNAKYSALTILAKVVTYCKSIR